MKRIDDVPGWVIGRCHATFRFLFHVQSAMDDLAGAVKAEQWYVALHSLRDATLMAASVSRMSQSCDVLPDASDDFTGHLNSFDTSVDPALEALCIGVNLAFKADTEQTIRDAQALLIHYVTEIELRLGYGHEIPELRSSRGTSMLLRLFREGDQFARSLGLPSAVPRDWASRERV